MIGNAVTKRIQAPCRKPEAVKELERLEDQRQHPTTPHLVPKVVRDLVTSFKEWFDNL